MKHIKKSMFISTVLMVVMLIAALSTATFAWYTSNNSVVSTATQVGAAKSQSANIGIGWYRTAVASQIDFDELVDAESQGGMYPMVPNTYYQQMKRVQVEHAADSDHDDVWYTYEIQADTATTPTVNGADGAYVTSPIGNVTTGIIAEAFGSGKNSKRIINLTSTNESNAAVKDKATFTHDVTSTPKKITNLDSSAFTGDYQIVYTSIAYTYNNTIFDTSAENLQPSSGETRNIITINDHVGTDNDTVPGYIVETPEDNNTDCYTVYDVYTVVATGGSETIPAKTAASKEISQMCAYTNVGVACNPGTFVVAYIEYKVIPFNAINTTNGANVTTADIQRIDTTALSFEGYAAEQNGTANDGDIYKTDVVATYGVNANINWNSDGFAYLYQIYKTNAPSTALVTGTGDRSSNFKFTEANIDANNYFKKTNNYSIEPLAFWSGNNGGTYSAAKRPAIITTRDSTVDRGTRSVFYVVNNGTDAEATVDNLKVSINVSGDNADLLRIAVFKNGQYFGTLGRTAATHFGSVIEGANAADLPTYDAVTQIELGTLATGADAAFEMKLVAWFDGEGLDDIAAGKNCSFTLSFEA